MQAHQIRRTTVAMAALVAMVTGMLALIAAPAGAVTFTNTNPITIPSGAPGTTSGPASPYPSFINVTGLTGNMTDVNVTLNGVQHTWPDDLDIALVAPGGQRVLLLAGAGGDGDANAGGITFDQAAATQVPDNGPLVSGTYRPSGYEAFSNATPAGPFSLSLNTFNGVSGNGFWALYVYDDSGQDYGAINGGWRLDISTGPVIASFTPASGPVGTSVTIFGTGFNGATAVRFGGVAATTFTVDSNTQITATVPTGATTGPVSVTTAGGTGNSTSNFSVTATPPTITSFSPIDGTVGDQVVITGTNLTSATSVTFNGAVATFAVNSATQITATVPTGASTGLISVTTSQGSASSSTAFVVKHVRSITLDVGGRTARGKVTVNDGFDSCRTGVEVVVKYDDGPGNFDVLGTATTTATGRFSVRGASGSGRYRAIATKVTLASGDVCNKKAVTESK